MIHMFANDVVDQAIISNTLKAESIDHWVWKNSRRITVYDNKHVVLFQIKYASLLNKTLKDSTKSIFPTPKGIR